MSNKPGLNLADLAPLFEDVPLGNDFIRVYGISAKSGLNVFQRYPKIAGMLSGGFDLKVFMSVAPDAVAAIIAAATGFLGDERAEQNASDLSIETQFDILEAIGRLTFTKGFAPFAKRIMALADVANSASFTKVAPMKSPAPSKPSSSPDTPQA